MTVFGFSEEFETCKKFAEKVRQDLKKAGFVVNEKNSIWRPVKKKKKLIG